MNLKSHLKFAVRQNVLLRVTALDNSHTEQRRIKCNHATKLITWCVVRCAVLDEARKTRRDVEEKNWSA